MCGFGLFWKFLTVYGFEYWHGFIGVACRSVFRSKSWKARVVSLHKIPTASSLGVKKDKLKQKSSFAPKKMWLNLHFGSGIRVQSNGQVLHEYINVTRPLLCSSRPLKILQNRKKSNTKVQWVVLWWTLKF